MDSFNGTRNLAFTTASLERPFHTRVKTDWAGNRSSNMRPQDVVRYT